MWTSFFIAASGRRWAWRIACTILELIENGIWKQGSNKADGQMRAYAGIIMHTKMRK